MPANADEIEARIATSRDDLADSLQQLSHRLSPAEVKARSRAAVSERVSAAKAATPSWAPPAAGVGLLTVVILLVRRRRSGRSTGRSARRSGRR